MLVYQAGQSNFFEDETKFEMPYVIIPTDCCFLKIYSLHFRILDLICNLVDNVDFDG